MGVIQIENEVLHRIDAKIYGHFIEELGECIHDGLWASAPRLADCPRIDEPGLQGVRRDVFSAARELLHRDGGTPTVLRWPGGCFADVYHWRDGIGDSAHRPVRRNAHWGRGAFRFIRSRDGVLGPDVHNQFGTDEFLRLCELLAVEPYINVNYGSGTPREAADWVEYVNGGDETRWGSERARVHPAPYRVRYWGIANEIWARWERGHESSASAYAERYLEFATAMKERDPSIRLIACGLDRVDGNPLLSRDRASWNRTLLDRTREELDYLSLHYYVPTHSAAWLLARRSARYAWNDKGFRALMASPALIRERIERMWEDITAVLGADTKVRIAVDEWNVWYAMRQAIKANYTLADGLWVACVLQDLQALAPLVGMANLAQMVNVLGLIRTDDEGVVRTPSHHAFRLLRQTCGELFLSTRVECEAPLSPRRFGIPSRSVPSLSCTTTMAEHKPELTLTMINRSLDEATTASVAFNGFGGTGPALRNAWLLTHADPFAMNTPANRDAVTVREAEAPRDGADGWNLPPHSLTVAVFDLP